MKLEYNKPDAVTDFIDSGDSIYHFTKKEIAIEHILYNKKLKFGNFKQTNDPREYKRRMTSAVGWGWEDEQLQKISEIPNSIDEFIKSSGFLSFCQKNPVTAC